MMCVNVIVVGHLTCPWCPATPLSGFGLRVFREINWVRSPENNLGWYSVSLGVFLVQISTQNTSQCNINKLSDLRDFSSELLEKMWFYVGDTTPKLQLFVLICQTLCVYINLVYVCFTILFYALNTGYS